MKIADSLKAIAVILVGAAGSTAQANAPDGLGLYQTHCAACHGASLEGAEDWRTPGPDGMLPPPPHDESGHTWHHGDQFLFDYVKHGGQAVLDDLGVRFTSGMPGFAGALTNAEITAILDFIRTSWPQHIREIQATRTAIEAEAAQQ